MKILEREINLSQICPKKKRIQRWKKKMRFKKIEICF